MAKYNKFAIFYILISFYPAVNGYDCSSTGARRCYLAVVGCDSSPSGGARRCLSSSIGARRCLVSSIRGCSSLTNGCYDGLAVGCSGALAI